MSDDTIQLWIACQTKIDIHCGNLVQSSAKHIASAFLVVRYRAAFTACLLNNQLMGFYSPATIVKDAQLHGVRVKPIDAMCSHWNCSLENADGEAVLRMGLRYVRGLQQIAGESLMYAREECPFTSTKDLSVGTQSGQSENSG